MRKALLIAAGVVVLLAAGVGILYLVFPDEFRNNMLRYNPFGERVDEVISEPPKPSAPPLTKSEIVEVKGGLPLTAQEQRRVLVYLPKGFRAGSTDRQYP